MYNPIAIYIMYNKALNLYKIDKKLKVEQSKLCQIIDQNFSLKRYRPYIICIFTNNLSGSEANLRDVRTT